MKEAASIFLRAEIRPNDGYNLIRWVKNKNVTRYLNESSKAAGTVNALLSEVPPCMLTYYFNQMGAFYLICDGRDRSIGFIKLQKQARDCYEVVYAIGEETLWGRGFGKAALKKALNIVFFEKRAKIAVAKIHHGNTRSIRTAVHCGMRKVKTGDQMSEYAVSSEDYLLKRPGG